MRPIPQTVCDRAELLARSHPLQTVAELLGKKPSVITRMKQRGWRAADYASQRRPIPTDFGIVARKLSHRQLCAHYRCGFRTVERWFRERPVRPPFKPGKKTGGAPL